jgi:hypothetical protein
MIKGCWSISFGFSSSLLLFAAILLMITPAYAPIFMQPLFGHGSYCSNLLPRAAFIITAVQGNGMAQTNINMQHVNKQGFRSLKCEAMKKIKGGFTMPLFQAAACPKGNCSFALSNGQIVSGSCYANGDGGCNCITQHFNPYTGAGCGVVVAGID